MGLLARGILRRLYSLFQSLYYAIFCPTIDVGYNSRIVGGAKLEGYNKIHDNSVFYGSLGKYSYIGANSHITAKIGKFCSIGPSVKTVCAFHPVDGFVSTHPIFYSTNKQSGITFTKEQLFDEWKNLPGLDVPVEIGNDVFIGEGSLLIGNIRIGDGTVIASGAVVTKDIPPYCIVAGNPAKLIRKRFDDETIEKLQLFKWWNKDERWLKQNVKIMSDVRLLLSYIYNNEVKDKSIIG